MYVHRERDGYTVTFGCVDMFVSNEDIRESDLEADCDFAKAVEIAYGRADFNVMLEEAWEGLPQ